MAASELIDRLISGDEGAFKMVVDTNAPMIFRVIMNFGVRREDAEDLSQEVFLDAFRNIRKFRNDAEISTWLYRIAINKSLNFVKKHKDSKRANFQLEDLKTFDRRWPVESSEEQFVTGEQRTLLYNSIEKLSENQRIAFTLNKLDELSYKEISDIMMISVSSVESLIHRAKIKLQNILVDFFK